MNWKVVVIGTIVFYVVMFVLGFVTGPLIHQGVLKADYQTYANFWRPELRSDPPDMAALMPTWIATGLVWSLTVVIVFVIVRPCIKGTGWKRGIYFGLLIWLLTSGLYVAYWGLFDLPAKIWMWWSIDGLIGMVIGGAVLGIVTDKLSD